MDYPWKWLSDLDNWSQFSVWTLPFLQTKSHTWSESFHPPAVRGQVLLFSDHLLKYLYSCLLLLFRVEEVLSNIVVIVNWISWLSNGCVYHQRETMKTKDWRCTPLILHSFKTCYFLVISKLLAFLSWFDIFRINIFLLQVQECRHGAFLIIVLPFKFCLLSHREGAGQLSSLGLSSRTISRSLSLLTFYTQSWTFNQYAKFSRFNNRELQSHQSSIFNLQSRCTLLPASFSLPLQFWLVSPLLLHQHASSQLWGMCLA